MSMTNASETGHVDAFNFGDLDRNTTNAIQAMPASKGHVAMLLDLSRDWWMGMRRFQSCRVRNGLGNPAYPL